MEINVQQQNGGVQETQQRILFNSEANSIIMSTRAAVSEIFSKMANSREEQEFDVRFIFVRTS
jgi:hypothetical protein